MVLKIQQNAGSFIGKVTNFKALKYPPLHCTFQYITVTRSLFLLYQSWLFELTVRLERGGGERERCICTLSRGTREPSCVLGVRHKFCLRLPTGTKKCSIILHIAPLFPIYVFLSDLIILYEECNKLMIGWWIVNQTCYRSLRSIELILMMSTF